MQKTEIPEKPHARILLNFSINICGPATSHLFYFTIWSKGSTEKEPRRKPDIIAISTISLKITFLHRITIPRRNLPTYLNFNNNSKFPSWLHNKETITKSATHQGDHGENENWSGDKQSLTWRQFQTFTLILVCTTGSSLN